MNPTEIATALSAFDPEPWRADLSAYLRRRGAGGEADDLVQETFLRSLRRPPRGRARPWLFGIALNLLRDRRKTRERVAARESASAPPAAPADPADAVAHGELAARALARMRRLPAGQRRALELRLLAQQDYPEVARALGCSPATARQHVHLALKALRDALADGESP